MMTPFMCAGCKEPIMERYLMKVLDKSWHVHCVKCSDCQCQLNEKCFSRESKLYCRTDFFKRYGTRCAGCNIGLCPEDLVRRAVNRVYHIQCFLCSLCRKQLSTGENLYLVQGERFLCEPCYQMSTQSGVAATTTTSSSPLPASITTRNDTAVPTTTARTPSDLTPTLSASTPMSARSLGADGKKHKSRTSITPQQLDVLLSTYNKVQRPSKPLREELMAKTGLDMKVIQVWFQNRRSKEKRDATYRDNLKDEPGPHSSVLSSPALTPMAGSPLTVSVESTGIPIPSDTSTATSL